MSIMDLEKMQLNELKQSELKRTSGGNIFAYAVGYLVGTAQSVLEGAYARGYDGAQNNCGC